VHAHHAEATGQLAVPEDECRDVFFATTDGTLWRALVERQGWSDDRYSAWLGALGEHARHTRTAVSRRIPASTAAWSARSGLLP
jgi:hypothetical protein